MQITNPRTKAMLQSQWNTIEKEIRGLTTSAAVSALKQYGYGALKRVDDYSSYDSDTGNLDDSLMFGIFVKGKYQNFLSLSESLMNKKTHFGNLTEGKGTPDRYTARTSVTINTRYGTSIDINKGDSLLGREESEKALKNYENVTSGGYSLMAEMIIVAEMFYRYFLENKDGYNWIRGFEEFESNYERESREYIRILKQKQLEGRNRAKNVKVV